MRSRIYDCQYWKEHGFGLTAESLLDKATQLRAIGGTFGAARKPAEFLCLVLKLLQLQLCRWRRQNRWRWQNQSRRQNQSRWQNQSQRQNQSRLLRLKLLPKPRKPDRWISWSHWPPSPARMVWAAKCV